jgi:hypothetical protein
MIFLGFYPKKGSFWISDLIKPADILRNRNLMPHLRSLIPNLCSGVTRKIRDFDLRLGSCGICASEIYFSIFLENNEAKKLK